MSHGQTTSIHDSGQRQDTSDPGLAYADTGGTGVEPFRVSKRLNEAAQDSRDSSLSPDA